MKEDLEDYLKCLAVKRGCLVDSVDRNKAQWNLIMNRKACMEEIRAYKEDKQFSTRTSRDRHQNKDRRDLQCFSKQIQQENRILTR